MKLIKEIKRRARNVRRAIRGEEVGMLPDATAPLKIEHTQAEVQVYRYEKAINVTADDCILPEKVEQLARREMVQGLAEVMQVQGDIKFETHKEQGAAGPGYILTAEVRVLRPKKQDREART